MKGLARQREETIRLRRVLRGLGLPIDVVLTSPDQLAQYADNPYTIFEAALKEGMVVYEREAA